MKLGVESWGAIGGIWVSEALELMTEHRTGNYTLWRGGRVGLGGRGILVGRGSQTGGEGGGAGNPAQVANQRRSAHVQGCARPRPPLLCSVRGGLGVEPCASHLRFHFLLFG